MKKMKLSLASFIIQKNCYKRKGEFITKVLNEHKIFVIYNTCL